WRAGDLHVMAVAQAGQRIGDARPFEFLRAFAHERRELVGAHEQALFASLHESSDRRREYEGGTCEGPPAQIPRRLEREIDARRFALPAEDVARFHPEPV